MAIKLIVTSYQRYSPDQESERTFDEPDFRIGRELDNDWVLSDPEKKLSRHHCTIERRGDDYVLTDTSSNGVFVNHSDARVGQGKHVLLGDGDVLTLGDYELTIAMIAEAAVDSTPAAPVDDDTPILSEEYDLGLGPEAASSSSEAGGSVMAEPVGVGEIDEFFQAPLPSGEPLIPEGWDEEAPTSYQPSLEPLDQTSADALVSGAQEQGDGGEPALDGTDSAGLSGSAGESKSVGVSLDDAALRAFLRGAGLPDFDLSGVDPTALMETQGRLFRELVAGLMQGLAGRRDIKEEFRLGQTQIRQSVNNLFKFLPTPDEAMKVVLDGGGSAYMEPIEAAREGFRDLNAHQMAVIAGTEAAYRHLLERFEPGALEERFGSHAGLVGLLPATRKSRYWDFFKELYAQIKEQSEDNFEDLFGREFARAYEEEIRKLSS